MGKNLLLHKLAFKGMAKALKILGHAFKESVINRNTPDYKTAREEFLAGIKSFTERLQSNKFHGGDMPDEADFTVYGILKSKTGSESFTSFLKREASPKFLHWLRLMDTKCKYQEYNYEG